MEPRPESAHDHTPRRAKALCRIEVLQAALNGHVPPEHRLEHMLDRIDRPEVRS